MLVTRDIFPQAFDFLKNHVDCEVGKKRGPLTKEALMKKIWNKQGLLSLLMDTVDREVMDAAPSLKIIANCAVGYNNIDIAYARKKGILVTNTPGILTDATADLTWALILAVARRIPQADRFTRGKKFHGWELDLFLGKDITGKCLGIVGMGRIGKAVAQRAQAFRMEVVYSDPKRLPLKEEKAYRATFLPLEDLLATADIVTLHTTLTPQTHHLITREKLELMKQDAILVNVSRGGVVDEQALAEALSEGKLWGAGLDVYEQEPEINNKLLSLDNIVLLPHIGSATTETRLKMAMMAARNLVQGLQGQTPNNLIWK